MPLGATADAVARPALGTPVIKGSIFARVVGEAAALLAAGEVSLAELGRWLRPEDCALLAEAPISSGWYPLDAYTRLNGLIRDVAGGGSNAYLRERGKETARQLLESGRYPQLEYSRRTELARTADPRERFAAFGRDLRIFASVAANVVSCSRWTPGVDPEHHRRYRLVVSQAQGISDVFGWRCDGFINELAAEHGEPELWYWERAESDRIVFRINRSI